MTGLLLGEVVGASYSLMSFLLARNMIVIGYILYVLHTLLNLRVGIAFCQVCSVGFRFLLMTAVESDDCHGEKS